jgi:hypothetical protein
MQQNSNVIPSLGISACTPNILVASHIITLTTLPPMSIPYSTPSLTYTTPYFSSTSHNTNNDLLIH